MPQLHGQLHGNYKFCSSLPLQWRGSVHLVRGIGHFDDALLNALKVKRVLYHLHLRNQLLVDVAKVDYRLVGHDGVVGWVAPQEQPFNLVVRKVHRQERHVHEVLWTLAGGSAQCRLPDASPQAAALSSTALAAQACFP